MQKRDDIKRLCKRVILTILGVWLLMSVFLSIKVFIWHNVSYKQNGNNNPYSKIMTDRDFVLLSSERDEEKEVTDETHVFIPITVWYGVRAKTLCYVYYRSYYENGKLYNGTDGFYTIDLKFEDFKWKVEYVEGMVP